MEWVICAGFGISNDMIENCLVKAIDDKNLRFFLIYIDLICLKILFEVK